MPKMVDHEQRRGELAEAVWRVIARDGVDELSIRTVAAESGWSSGALRHYFATRADLLAFACERVIAQVTDRIQRLDSPADPRAAARQALLETMPVDEQRHTECSIAFAFLALGLGDPGLARVQRAHFTAMADLCGLVVGALVPGAPDHVSRSRRLHAVVDGLSVHVLAEHLTVTEMTAELDRALDALTA